MTARKPGKGNGGQQGHKASTNEIKTKGNDKPASHKHKLK